jgi:RNA polymerase sigma factor (sigma-70 family)
MAMSQVNGVLEHLQRTVLLREHISLTDGQLLEEYISRREEAALATLARRHGPMIWGVCRRLLVNHHDAEDAFQAAFLVLVRKASSIVPRDMVANWLYGVAVQTAMKARATAARRKGRERQVTDLPERTMADLVSRNDLQYLLDEELKHLPNKYRAVIVLCDLEGRTRKEAAEQLKCPQGTIAGRLARARTMLAKRLTLHGLAVPGGSMAVILSQMAASANTPASVVSLTIQAACQVATGQAAVTSKVAVLTEGVLKAMLFTKLRIATVMVFLSALVCGAAILTSNAQEGKKDPIDTKQEAAVPKQVKEDDDKLKETILALDDELWEGYTKSDLKVFEKYLAEDYHSIWQINDGKLDKAATLDHFKRNKYSDKDIQGAEVVRIDKDSAVLTYVCTYKATALNEESRKLRTRCTYVWTKRNGSWVIVFCQGCGEEVPPLPPADALNLAIPKP